LISTPFRDTAAFGGGDHARIEEVINAAWLPMF
jgi:hypothetical protein